jgi:hypothetical protein
VPVSTDTDNKRTDYSRSFRQTSLTSLGRRLRYFVSRLFGSRLQKSQRVALVEINGLRYKRVILRDSYLATLIEQSLEAFGPSTRLPELVMRYEHEVWVEFVAGEIPNGPSEQLAADLARFYAHVYSRSPRQVESDGDIWTTRLRRDIRFLANVGVLSPEVDASLERSLVSRIPPRYWIGYDYNDPVIKNFVYGPGGELNGIDIEALVPEQLIGLGVAKALMRWMEPHRTIFFDTYAKSGGPDIAPFFDFVELSQLAAYTKLMFVERKWANIVPARFDRFC